MLLPLGGSEVTVSAPSLTPDELTIYVAVGDTKRDLAVAKRKSLCGSAAPPQGARARDRSARGTETPRAMPVTTPLEAGFPSLTEGSRSDADGAMSGAVESRRSFPV